jgi:hypothetical protein
MWYLQGNILELKDYWKGSLYAGLEANIKIYHTDEDCKGANSVDRDSEESFIFRVTGIFNHFRIYYGKTLSSRQVNIHLLSCFVKRR